MLLKLEVIAIISTLKIVNVYFYQSDTKVIMPVTFNNWFNLSEKKFTDLFKKIDCTQNQILNIRIIKKKCYLVILRDKKIIEISIDYQFGLLLAQKYNFPIFTSYTTLESEGIKVTKEMINTALSINY